VGVGRHTDLNDKNLHNIHKTAFLEHQDLP